MKSGQNPELHLNPSHFITWRYAELWIRRFDAGPRSYGFVWAYPRPALIEAGEKYVLGDELAAGKEKRSIDWIDPPSDLRVGHSLRGATKRVRKLGGTLRIDRNQPSGVVVSFGLPAVAEAPTGVVGE